MPPPLGVVVLFLWPATARAQAVPSSESPPSDAPASSIEPPPNDAPDTTTPPAIAPASSVGPPASAPPRDRETAPPRDAETPPSRAGTTTWEATLGANFSYAALIYDNPFFGVSESVTSGGANAGARLFVRPVVNDDAPLMLQPYLQRASTLSLRLGGIGSRTLASDTSTGSVLADQTVTQLWCRFDVDQYLTRFFAVWGAVELDALSATAARIVAVVPVGTSNAFRAVLPLTAGIGFRIDETRIDLGYAIAPFVTDTTPWQVPYWAHAFASVTTVIRRRVALTFTGEVLHWGLGTSARAELFPTSRLGIHLRAKFARWATDPYTAFNQLAGALAFSYWFSARFGGSAEYAVTWSGGSFPWIENGLSVSAFARW